MVAAAAGAVIAVVDGGGTTALDGEPKVCCDRGCDAMERGTNSLGLTFNAVFVTPAGFGCVDAGGC